MVTKITRGLSLLVVASFASGTGCKGSGSNNSTAVAATCELVKDGHGQSGSATIKVEVVAKGLEVPWGIAFLPNGDMLVTERPGRIRVVTKDGVLQEPVATPAVSDSAEAGLLGIALHPRFEENRQLYVYLTGKGDDGEDENRVERYILDPSFKEASFDKIILGGIAAAKYHDGGRIRFGPDGMLYVGTGDARQPERSLDPASNSGKLLRLTPEGEAPADNPNANSPVYLLGIRNLQAFDWLDDSTIVLADHGPSGEYQGRSGHDEVTVAHKGDNLGWPTIYACESKEGLVSPVLTWKEATPPGGGSVYRGNSISAWQGAFVIGTLRSEHLHVVHFEAQSSGPKMQRHEVYLSGDKSYGRLRDVVMGPDGHLYITTSNCDGRGDCGSDKDLILRISGQ